MKTLPNRLRPLAAAAMMLLAGQVQAQDFSLNSLTVDTQSGQTLGSLNRQGEVKRFFEVQKEVVFNTLRHLGLSPEELPPKLRQELEKPQTTDANAFALFARALDMADKGQFGVAGDLLRDAARIDPGFALARGMSRLMPAISIPSGAERQAVRNLKQAALEQGRKTGQELNNSLNQKDQSFNKESESQQGADKTRKQLGVLEKGEDQKEGEGEGGARQGMENLGMSDSGGEDAGGAAAPAGMETLAVNLATLGVAEPQTGSRTTLAAGGDVPASVAALTTQIQDANEDNLREDVIENETPVASGLWVSLANGAMTRGAAVISRNDRGGAQSPADVVIALTHPEQTAQGSLEYRSQGGDAASFTLLAADLWGAGGAGDSGHALAFDDDAYVAEYHQAGDARMLAVAGGIRTTAAQLAVSGVHAYSMTLKGAGAGATFVDFYDMGVNYANNAMFSPMTVDPYSDSASMLLGALDRQNARLDATLYNKNYPGQSGEQLTGWGVSEGLSLALYGAGHHVAAGVASGVAHDQDGGVSNLQLGFYGQSWGGNDYGVPPAPGEGEVWRGHASNLLVNGETGAYTPGSGDVTLTFAPGAGAVTGEFSDDALGVQFDNRQGRGAYVQGNLFGGVQEQQEGAPFMFSSRSQYTRWEALISEKEFHDALAHHYVGQWTADAGAADILPVSTWVAGAVSANLPASGQVRYQGYASGVWRPADGAQYDLVSGLFDLRVDFASRDIHAGVENLSWAVGAGLSGARPSAGFSLEGGLRQGASGYALITDDALIEGNFFGADASETGGRWSLTLEDGGVIWGVHSATSLFSRGAAPFNAGSLSSFGEGGVFAAGNPMAAWFGSYTDDGLWYLYGNFIAPGGVGNLSLTDNTVGWRPVSGTSYGEWTLSGTDLASFYAVDNSQTHHFSNAASYLQKTSDDAFTRAWLVDVSGALVEAYSGNIADTRPDSGITRFDLNQTALRLDAANPRMGQLLRGNQNGEAGIFPGQLYVNWQTGQAVGYNLSPGIGDVGGVGVFLGSVDADSQRIQGRWLARGYRQTVDEADSPRWMTDTSGVTLDLYGVGGVSAAAGVFDATWQDEHLGQTTVNADGRAQITALASGSLGAGVAPAVNEAWNGFAVGNLVERQTGERFLAVNNDAEDVTIRLNRDGGHASVEMRLESGAGEAVLDMAGQGSDSAYVSPKAFAVTQLSNSVEGGTYAPDFLVATPEMTGRDEAARYDYTSWGVWGADFREGKDLTATPNSMWVAGKLTQTVDMPVSGRAEYTGQVLGQVSGAQSGYVRGNLAMSVDFGNRSVGGALNDLRVISGSLFNQSGAANGALWIDRATLNGGWNAGTQQYSATLAGKDVVSGSLRGAFFGPQALETGGRWNISTQGGSGAGIYVGKRGGINP